MFRNREIGFFVLIMCAISLTGVLVSLLFSVRGAVVMGIVSVLLICCTLLDTRWRYKEIEKLSNYLHRISNGDYSLDVRDNYEGELSILKNNIYKVTLMLSEQSTTLQQDKIELTDAISDISHQLKTPLTSMTVMADLLTDTNLPDQKRTEFTHNIQMQLERIDWLVSSLLKLSKIDAGTAQFKQEAILVKRLIEQALEPLLIPIDIKEQTISVTGDADISVTCDLKWTVEALINVLKNSVEHTDPGGEITIHFAENALFTEIVIADSGKGIPKEDLPYIFKRFYKGKQSGEDSVGIGLAMAYRIIAHQNGDVEVKSTEGIGTEFRIRFYKQSLS